MYDLYVPESLQDYSCFFYNDAGTILYATNSVPIQNESLQVEKIFVNNHYSIVSDTIIPNREFTCLTNHKTTNWFYRKDAPEIAFLVVVFSIFFFYIPLKIFSRLFKKGGF